MDKYRSFVTKIGLYFFVSCSIFILFVFAFFKLGESTSSQNTLKKMNKITIVLRSVTRVFLLSETDGFTRNFDQYRSGTISFCILF